MKLLFDHNLSFRLVQQLGDICPGSTHVADFSMACANDDVIWQHAARNGFVIVSKDDDFRQRSFLRGHPPKVVEQGSDARGGVHSNPTTQGPDAARTMVLAGAKIQSVAWRAPRKRRTGHAPFRGRSVRTEMVRARSTDARP